MSWKTNPVANRLKQTIGWKFILPESNQKTLAINNIKSFKNLWLLKCWLKYKKWHLLYLQQVWSKNSRIWYITALRLPKKNRKYNRVVKTFGINDDLAGQVIDSLHYTKKISLVRGHFKNRKQLFHFVHNKKTHSSLPISKTAQMKAHVLFKKTTLQLILKKKWLNFLGNLSTKNFLSLQDAYDVTAKTRQLSYNLNKLNKKTYGLYDFTFREWEGVKLRKNVEFRRKEWHFLENLLKIKKYSNENSYLKKTNVPPIRRKIYTRPIINLKLYAKDWKKIKYAKQSKSLFCINAFLLRGKMQKLKKTKIAFLSNASPTFVEKYNSNSNNLGRLLLKENNKPVFLNLKRYKQKHTKKMQKKASQMRVRLYSRWRTKYITIRQSRNQMIKRFLKIMKRAQKIKKKLKYIYKTHLYNRRRLKRAVFKHRIAYRTRAWLKKKRDIARIRSENMRWQGFRKNTKNPAKKYAFTTRLVLKIDNTRKLEARIKRKLLLTTYRMNFLFKKIIRHVLRLDNDGKSIVKFLQPVRMLLSTKKLRKFVAKNTAIARYRRQKMYKRLLPFISILVRYWHPQPLLEQIAFEMQKTKKHWPLLKTIRALIKNLKPTIFAGYRIAIKGKISSSDRTRTFYIKDGRIPTNTFKTRMTYAMWQSDARTGSFGIKGWVYFTK